MSVLENSQMPWKTDRSVFKICCITLTLSVGLAPAFVAAHFAFTDHVYCRFHDRLEHRKTPEAGVGEQHLSESEALSILSDYEEQPRGCLLILGLANPGTTPNGTESIGWIFENPHQHQLHHIVLPHQAISWLSLAPKTSPPVA